MRARRYCGNCVWSLGGDVDRVGVELVKPGVQAAVGKQRQPDLGVGRARHRAEAVRAQEANLVSQGPEPLPGADQRRDDAVDLRPPGVGDDRDLHSHPDPWRSRLVSERDCVPTGDRSGRRPSLLPAPPRRPPGLTRPAPAPVRAARPAAPGARSVPSNAGWPGARSCPRRARCNSPPSRRRCSRARRRFRAWPGDGCGRR
jgi:hypothetical protein